MKNSKESEKPRREKQKNQVATQLDQEEINNPRRKR